MKKALILIFSIFLSNSIFSQDLIVTKENDSINAKITKIKNNHLYFSFKHKDEIRNTLLPMANVKTHQFEYFKTSAISKDEIVGYDKNYSTFRISINGGYSFMTAQISESVPNDFKDYVKELKSGYHFGVDLTYYSSEQLGFGLKYYLFKSSNSLDNIYVDDLSGNRTFGKLSDDLTISFVGPTFSTRISNHDKSNAFITSLSLGYMGYKNNGVLINKYKLTGGTTGLALDIGYDIGLSKNLSLGFQITSLTGILKKVNLNNGGTVKKIEYEEEDWESLNRLDFSFGLRYNN